MEFRLLGELEVRVDGRLLEVGTPRQQAVLAALALDARRPVPIEVLIDRVWDDVPPAGARNVLYAHVSRIRRMLGQAARTGSPVCGTVERRPAGYVLDVDPNLVDLHRFRGLLERTRDLERSDADRAITLSDALELWRGTPLAGVPGSWAEQVRRSCRQQRVDAVVLWAQVQLRLGCHDAVIATLPDLVCEHPLVEPLEGLLMQALHQAGRDAEALDRYTAIRQRLAEHLGVDPGAELRALHQAILRGELPPSDQPDPAATPSAAATPAQLPPDVAGFTGRDAQLRQLDALLTAVDGSTAMAIAVVSGTAGVGKTGLAVHWAHRVSGLFPDGQLYIDMQGYSPDGPLSTDDALATLMRSLGDRGDFPFGLAERTARYRTLLAGRRMLVVLDNAHTAEHVLPLLPGTPSCFALVTSRDSLAGLVVRQGAIRLTLGMLPATEAVALLRALIGERARAQPAAVADLAERCARLPLALRLSAELAVSRPATPLTDLLGELSDESGAINALDEGFDERTAVRAVFSWSHRHLSPTAARMFELFGAQPCRDVDGYAAAALLDCGLPEARRTLDALARAHVITPDESARFGMHDLLRAYAVQRANPNRTMSALTRLIHHYLATAATAADALFPARPHHRPRGPQATTPAPPLSGPGPAREWLDRHRANLVAVTRFAADRGWPEEAVRLSATLWTYLDTGSHYDDAVAINEHALRAARLVGDRAGESAALHNLGRLEWLRGRSEEALGKLQLALAIRRETGDRAGEGRTLGSIGSVYWRWGDQDRALEHYRRALAIRREIGDRAGEAITLGNIGVVHEARGDYDKAIHRYEQALTIYRELGEEHGAGRTLGNLGVVYQARGDLDKAIDQYVEALAIARTYGDRLGEGTTLSNLAYVYARQGHHERAIDHDGQALTLAREIGDREGEAYALAHLGEVHVSLGRLSDAASCLAKALNIAREIGERRVQAQALNGLGRLRHAAGETPDARALHGSALALARDVGDRLEQAHAVAGIGNTFAAEGRHADARQHWREALAGYDELRVSHADDVRRKLDQAG